MAKKKKDVNAEAIALHKKLAGKIAINGTFKVKDRAGLSLVYTPGVAAVSSLLHKDKKKARDYTIKGKTVAVISDGSAVLGLGNIGPYGALPVMEGKCALFKTFAGVEAFPLVLDTQDPEKIIEAVMAVAPVFGGINLEDIAAPKCFYIEEELKRRLDIPVMHDDQHGTAVVVLAALINALKVVKKQPRGLRVVISGVGAAGVAIMKLLKLWAPSLRMVAIDSEGIVWGGRNDINDTKRNLLEKGIIEGAAGGSLAHALKDADVFIGVSKPGVVTAAMVRSMAKDAIVFAMANPTPEIMPDVARAAGARVVGTGRSDFPNQINNSLAFPGIFRGALDNRVTQITDAMKIKAAKSLAALVKKPAAERIVPGPFDAGVARAVAKAVR